MFSFFKKKKTDAPAKEAKPAKAAAAKDAKASSPAETKASSEAKAKKPALTDAPKDPKDAKAGALPKTPAPPTSLRAALAAMEEAIPGAVPEDKPQPKISAGANLEKAKEALAKKASQPMDRQALIEQALAIQKVQAKKLDNLPQETRDKLRTLALKTFVLDQPKDKKPN